MEESPVSSAGADSCRMLLLLVEISLKNSKTFILSIDYNKIIVESPPLRSVNPLFTVSKFMNLTKVTLVLQLLPISAVANHGHG